MIVHNDYQQAGGEWVAVQELIKLLEMHGHELCLFLKDNVEINSYKISQKIALIPGTIFSVTSYKNIQATIAEFKPDVAHVHNVFPLISPSIYRAIKELGVPIVQTLHNFRFLCPNGLFYTHGHVCELCKYGNTLYSVFLRCYRDSYTLSALYALSIGLHRRAGTFRMIDQFIALTDFTAEKIVESGLTIRDKVSVLGNFLPDTVHEAGSIANKRPYVVYLGRLSPEKGVELLIRSMSSISSLELKIAGDGPQANELEGLARKLDLGNISFMGRVSGSQKWDLLRNAAASIVPSRCYENLSFTTLESIAVGTPVIASNIGSLPFIIKDASTGLLFQPDDVDDLREKIHWICTHPDEALELGKNGKKYFEENYSAEAHYTTLMDIYQKAIQKN